MVNKVSDFTIDVNCNLTIGTDTAEACLRLLELYVNSNRNIAIVCNKTEDGKQTFSFDGIPVVDHA